MVNLVHSYKASNQHQELISELQLRFPLFERVVGRFGEDTEKERIPWFFALLLSASTRSGIGANCFVLEKTTGTTVVVAILLALIKLQEDFPELVRNFAETVLERGQRVKVKPNDYVYEYKGVWQEYPELFKLKELGNANSRGFPIHEVLRLEPTERLLPKGKLSDDLGGFEQSSLDKLLNLMTCGNCSLIRNSVLLQITQAQFVHVVNKIALIPEDSEDLANLSTFLPWGTIGQNGELKPKDKFLVVGEPIVAVTRVLEDLALASSTAKNATKVVLLDGTHTLTNSLQAFDEIAEHQKVIILASSDETEGLNLLKDRNCPIWYMSPSELLLGEASSSSRTRSSLVGATIQAAKLRKHEKVTTIDCHDNVLQEVAKLLEYTAARIDESNEVSLESEEILGRLFGVLFECSECCFGVSDETKIKLQYVQEQIDRHKNWLEPEVSVNFQNANSKLEEIIANGNFGQHKKEELLNLLDNPPHKPFAIGARTHSTAKRLKQEIESLGENVPIIPVCSFSSESEYKKIILPSWPNQKRFSRLKSRAVAHEICILAYPFEKFLLSNYRAREQAREHANRMEIDIRSSILGIEPSLLSQLKHYEPSSPTSENVIDSPIFRIERRVTQRRNIEPTVVGVSENSREAQLVQFFGNCYSLLTEWAKLPKLNQLIEEGSSNEVKLESVTVSKLSQGDFLLFRASGEKEFIRLIAEDSLGVAEYNRIRTVAEQWKHSLRRLGTSSSEVKRRLEAHGLYRNLLTIEGWLSDSERIGPRDFQDLEFIAKAAEDVELLSIRKEVEEAIRCIRGAHISAGSQLTGLILGELSSQMNNLDDQPVLLNLLYGEAWVVQVDTVETEKHGYPQNSINRLLWSDDTMF